MNQNAVQRIKEDLAVISRAAGLETLVRREDVWVNLALAAGGLVTLVWALVPHGLPEQWGIVPLILLAVGYPVRMRVKYRRSTGRSPLRRRDYSAELVGALAIAGLAVVYRLWAVELGLSLKVAGSAALFIMGASMLLPVLRSRGRLADLGYIVPLILCGLGIPILSLSPWVLLGAAFTVGGVAAAGLTALQLRATGYAAD